MEFMNNNIELRKYIERAKELETAVFTQKKLMEEHKKKIRNEGPVIPQKECGVSPVCPTKPALAEDNNKTMKNSIVLIVVAACLIVGGLAASAAWGDASFFSLVLIGGVLLVLGGKLNTECSEEKASYMKKCEQFQLDMNEYKKELDAYKKREKKSESTYQYAMREYKERNSIYIKKSAEIMDKHDKTYKVLYDELEKHYAQNIVFAKYRNIVAISAIDEYLSSGRCVSLEGADGAYNLYEMELRQNIVIGQLSAIVDNLERIKSNQFTLYQELCKANNTVEGILAEVRGVNESARLTAYFTEMTALAASAPRVAYTIPI